jgi:endonuclease/exonuclease/phosphatase (EEP) superfamily protein YafD
VGRGSRAYTNSVDSILGRPGHVKKAGRIARALRVAVAFVLAGLLGCARATNYLAPDGPVYRGTAAASRDTAAAPAGSDQEIRVVTYNVFIGQRFELAAAGLRSHPDLKGVDLLLLQEMNALAVEWIARELGMSYVYYPASTEKKDGRDMGEAVLSPWPIEASEKILLPHLTRIAERSHAAAKARVRIRGRVVHAYSVHLGSPLGMSGGHRREEAEAVLADADRVEGPVIIGGDWNEKDLGELMEKRGYAWTTRDVGRTVKRFSFDHVFSRGMGKASRAGVARDLVDPSDHLPVWVTFPPLAPE